VSSLLLVAAVLERASSSYTIPLHVAGKSFVHDPFCPVSSVLQESDVGQPEASAAVAVVWDLGGLDAAIGEGDEDAIEESLLNQPDLAHTREARTGRTPLILAAAQGTVITPKVLSLLGPREVLDARDWQGRSTLHWAAAVGNEAVVTWLLANGLCVRNDRVTCLGEACDPFVIAVRNGHLRTAQAIVTATAESPPRAPFQRWLFETSRRGDDGEELARMLIGRIKGAESSADERNDIDTPALVLAAKAGCLVAVEGLLHLLGPEGRRTSSDEAMWWACCVGHEGVVKALRQAGQKMRPRHVLIATLTRRKGILADVSGPGGPTLRVPKLVANEAFPRAVAQVEQDPGVTAVRVDGGELVRAVSSGDTWRIKALLRLNPWLVEARELEQGWTPLIAAVAHHKTRIIALLLEAGANPRACGWDGRSALDVACHPASLHVTRALVQAGVHPSEFFRNGGSGGVTPHERLVACGAVGVVEYLQTARRLAGEEEQAEPRGGGGPGPAGGEKDEEEWDEIDVLASNMVDDICEY
jgi:ankyrin repeat protein